MILNWLVFFVCGVASYILISLYGQLTGGQSVTLLQAVISAVKPLPLLILVVGNVLFAAGLFIGFKNTQFAIPIFIAIGIITSYVYSLVVLNGQFSPLNILGIVLVLAGIFFLR